MQSPIQTPRQTLEDCGRVQKRRNISLVRSCSAEMSRSGTRDASALRDRSSTFWSYNNGGIQSETITKVGDHFVLLLSAEPINVQSK